MNFQQTVMALNEYWAKQGCLLWYPYSEKVGAGTYNPATILRVLGPEPWRVAYVEPSYRADDGRYAENPNRMQMHTQYQVILKPDPGNPQELYLASLAAIGIDRRRHDIRFVEDNWESPALGAWGLGWEVWLDGLEITQYTYFQQAGGFDLDPVAVELTYGLERIVMYLQNVNSVWDIDWDGRRTYGDVLRQSEIDHCIYNFDVADVNRLRQMYDLYEAEARNALQHKLVAPAHDYVLRCSQTFNLLDARGAVGVTERAGFFGRMRTLTRQVAQTYAEQRKEAGYPWLGAVGEVAAPPVVAKAPAPASPQTFLLEIGCEELPAAHVPLAMEQLSANLAALLDQQRLAHGEIRILGTPRRLVALVEGLAPAQADEETVLRGPRADVAFDKSGAPTPAVQGFARKNGVDVSALEVREDGANRYVYAVVRRPGRPAPDVLSETLPGLIGGLRFGRSMRWNDSGVSFSRPLRWFVSLLGENVVPFSYAGASAGRSTRGPRSEGSPVMDVANADSYLALLNEYRIIVNRSERRAKIATRVADVAFAAGGAVPKDPGLLDEVTDLVEEPTALLGSFATSYLHLPKDVLITVMKKHQRYFPVVMGEEMLPYFITVRNGGSEDLDLVRAGNERVLAARYADAEYFYRADVAHKLADYRHKLATLTFHEKLGSMLDKVGRVEELAPLVTGQLGLSQAERETTQRAAALFKNDLVTKMVVELTSLQGIMGREYALLSGEPQEVATAIYEHYLPRYQGDAVPATNPGLALSIANRIDTLAGLFAAGVAPTGSADPFGLRREALGLVMALAGNERYFSLAPAITAAIALLPDAVRRQHDGREDDLVRNIIGFVRDRQYGWLREQGLAHDVVSAVLAECAGDPYRGALFARQMADMVAAPGWKTAFTAYARCKRIVKDLTEQYALAPDLYTEPESARLYKAWQQAKETLDQAPVDRQIETLAAVLASLQPVIDPFFDKIRVMADEKLVREARLALLQRIAALSNGIADLSQLSGF